MFSNGITKPIEMVNDVVFSTKMIGDGMAIESSDGMIYAPTDGTITLIFPSLHAFGLVNDSGVELLLHLGLDTVELNGVPFESLVSVGEKVSANQKIATMDIKKVVESGKDPIAILVCTSGHKFSLLKPNYQATHGESGIFTIET